MKTLANLENYYSFLFQVFLFENNKSADNGYGRGEPFQRGDRF